MTHHVIVSFGTDREYEFDLAAHDTEDIGKDQARAWLAKEFEDLECTPSNPMGKVLVLDMILNVAKYGGEQHFRDESDWARRFAIMTAAALNRPVVRVDVAGFVVG
ncbi:MAG: hypothetical protein R3E45_13590 [Rhodocyclaceae bacterium]|nr:hypothetical protein [Rhodocyclaceae bacterium]MCP5231890.1 hypothetical protein [Zoogloeaceae bacterium]MCP5239444.1 hypothetical protein [Zoogloeaceae bacterium]MCP5255519.1 hypothetical protein [Zoogloeaceae bacterium]MCW5617222.1 hypothetical protein [Rhodocyclaceae bacterium]